MDPNIKQSIIDRLKQTNNVLVTVKKNPSVDHLAACIGLTLFLNKQGKHATAVFSGEVPSTIEFLKPEDTLEKDTNSLRDFIIALDKSKADKLRYKVEDKVVKIFITPYRTSLSDADLDFSQGDFNVDVVIAIGVHAREELDQAIMAHGRILHDATVVSINTGKAADLGALNWHDDKASSLSEMSASLVNTMQPKALDEQMSTAFLTGIVAETARFSNEKTSSATMSLSATLMASGANQQLVATQLQKPEKPQPESSSDEATDDQAESKPKDGTLQITHVDNEEKVSKELPQFSKEDTSDIHIDEQGTLKTGLQDQQEDTDDEKSDNESDDQSDKKDDETSKDSNDNDKKSDHKPSRLTLDPPTMGGTLTASAQKPTLEPSSDPLSANNDGSADTLNHKRTDVSGSEPNKKGPTIQPNSQTLSALEKQMNSPHAKPPQNSLQPQPETYQSSNETKADTLDSKDQDEPLQPANAVDIPATGIDDARKAVEQAAQTSLNQPDEPLQALNSQPLGSELHPQADESTSQQQAQTPTPDFASSQSQYQNQSTGSSQTQSTPTSAPTQPISSGFTPKQPNVFSSQPNVQNFGSSSGSESNQQPSPYPPSPQPSEYGFIPQQPNSSTTPAMTPSSPNSSTDNNQQNPPNSPPPVPPPMMPPSFNPPQ